MRVLAPACSIFAAGPIAAPRPVRPVRPVAVGVPDYTQPPVPGQRRRSADREGSVDRSSSSLSPSPSRKWWDYAAPSASIGRPDIEQKPVTIPQLSPGGGDGGSGGSSGGGGGGGGNGGNGGKGSSGDGGMKGFTYLFAALLFAGGLVGYFKKGSYKSLLFSGAISTLLLIATSVMHHRSGTLLALGTCLVLAAVMGQRANRSGKVFPAGVIAILSALMTMGYARNLV